MVASGNLRASAAKAVAGQHRCGSAVSAYNGPNTHIDTRANALAGKTTVVCHDGREKEREEGERTIYAAASDPTQAVPLSKQIIGRCCHLFCPCHRQILFFPVFARYICPDLNVSHRALLRAYDRLQLLQRLCGDVHNTAAFGEVTAHGNVDICGDAHRPYNLYRRPPHYATHQPTPTFRHGSRISPHPQHTHSTRRAYFGWSGWPGRHLVWHMETEPPRLSFPTPCYTYGHKGTQTVQWKEEEKEKKREGGYHNTTKEGGHCTQSLYYRQKNVCEVVDLRCKRSIGAATEFQCLHRILKTYCEWRINCLHRILKTTAHQFIRHSQYVTDICMEEHTWGLKLPHKKGNVENQAQVLRLKDGGSKMAAQRWRLKDGGSKMAYTGTPRVQGAGQRSLRHTPHHTTPHHGACEAGTTKSVACDWGV